MNKRPISVYTSANGMQMVHLHVKGSAVGYCGVAVRVGSRDESSDKHGLAHFVEHTIFKGTARRSSWHIINRMEAVGGELNAFTTKEETVVYSAFPNGNLMRAAELIADLITNSRFPDSELDKEREVVADEIDSYLDSPSEAVFDDFEDKMFEGSALGHNILGNREALNRFTSSTCREYLSTWYVASNMVAFYAGSMSAERAFRCLERAFGSVSGETTHCRRMPPEPTKPFDVYKQIESHQCHTVMGSRVGSLASPQRYLTALFTNILGGPGMNSLLNIALRERRGLVYSVDATTGLFSDCGSLAIYYGCDPKDNGLCRRLVQETIDSMASGVVTPRKLEMAKKQYLGQLILAGENVENHILAIARQYLFMGRVLSHTETAEGIRSVGVSDIKSMASELKMSIITLGPNMD